MLLTSLLLTGAFCAGFLLVRYTFWLPNRPANWPRILMYHHVSSCESDGMHMPAQKLERHIQWMIAKGYRLVTMSELLENPEKAVALTFDDGYEDNYRMLLPILKKYQVKATIYLITRTPEMELLNPEQIKEMQRSGLIEFGAHTRSHKNLCTLSDSSALREIEGSKLDIEALLGVPCKHFAYPFGRFLSKHQKMVRECGFISAVTTKKTVTNDLSEPYMLPRISMPGQMDSFQFLIAFRCGRYRL